MAFDVTALTAYIEDQDFPLIAQMQATGGLAGVVNKQVGIKGSSNLQFIDTDVVFGAAGCSRVPAMTSTFTQRTITVGAIDLSEDLCVKDLNGYWLQTKVGQGASGEESIPGDIEAAWLESKTNKIQNQLTICDFQGSLISGTNNLSYYDGLLVIIDSEGSVVDGNTGGVTVATGITAANVLAILDAMWSAMPDNITDRANNSLWIPTSVYKLYVIALKNANLFHYNATGEQETLYGTDVKLRKTVGLPGAAGSQRMILTHDDNITIGMDGEEEEDFDVRLDPSSKKSIFFDGSFKRGVQISFPDEIVEFTLVP